MRIVVCVLLIAWSCLGGSGCSLFNKKPKEQARPPASGGGKEPATFPGGRDPIKDGTANAAEYNGLLAGTVIDQYNNRPKEAYVGWVILDESKKDEAPIDVAATPEGYFTIRNLKPNQHYKLIARAKEGSRMLAGVTYVKTPDIHVLIKLTEDMVTPSTPPVPGPPAYTPKAEQNKKTSALPAERPASAQIPSWGPGNVNIGASPGGVPDLPAPVGVPAPVSAPVSSGQGWLPGIAAKEKSWPPVMEIPGYPKQDSGPIQINHPIPIPAGANAPGAPGSPPASTPEKGAGWSKTRVPSCVLEGKQLINFALYDLNHQPWEYKSQRRGKLLLLDFWGTMCPPCRDAIPHLRVLQSQYGASGLEVIGIACENGRTFEEQARRVQKLGQQLNTNYRLLLSHGDQCPVRKDFNVYHLPTLVLLDQNGIIQLRYEGRLDRYQLEELELFIKRGLGIR